MHKKQLLLFVALLSLLALTLAACGSEATPTEAPPDETVPTTAPEEGVGDPVWQQIQSSGMIRVGTSADYPPFEYYVEGTEIDGFDIALIKEIGSRLGLTVEITDFAFEGLGQTLQIGQTDALIAALSVTAEREEIVDFSDVYFAGFGAALVQESSSITTIQSLEDFADKRVGVQKASVYESWADDDLVATGIITPDQLFVYAKPEDAVRDMAENRLDVVVMDQLVAEEFETAAAVKIVGEGLVPQVYAIAVPKGAYELQANLNQAILDIRNDGTLAKLARDYLGVELDEGLLPPTATPAATATAGPSPTPAGCTNGMAFVKDLNYPDGTEVQPGESFTKGWQIANTGSCTWNDKYTLRYVRGSQMGGQNTKVSGEVASGATYDMSIDFLAPTEAGEYVSFWQMYDANGVPFGQTIWVAIVVPTSSGATATPEPQPTATATTPPEEPTATPVTCVIDSLTASPSSLQQGGNLVVSWSWTCEATARARLTRTDPDGTVVPLYGGEDVSNPGQYDDIAAKVGTLTYTLQVDSEFAASDTQSVQVTVTE
jgi:polar amino acid transport system substrate-binding protein